MVQYIYLNDEESKKDSADILNGVSFIYLFINHVFMFTHHFLF